MQTNGDCEKTSRWAAQTCQGSTIRKGWVNYHQRTDTSNTLVQEIRLQTKDRLSLSSKGSCRSSILLLWASVLTLDISLLNAVNRPTISSWNIVTESLVFQGNMLGNWTVDHEAISWGRDPTCRACPAISQKYTLLLLLLKQHPGQVNLVFYFIEEVEN